jgi:threonine dehydrogenase-like Zn-dependent dehydrogenase
MKKAVILGERRAALVDAPTPKAKGEWALVEVHAAPMCTEYKAFVAGRKAEFLGHEAAGKVVEVAQPGPVKAGDRVVVMPQAGDRTCPLCLAGDYIHCENAPDFAAVHGSLEGSATYAQYLLRQDWLLMPIPDDMSYERGSLACCALGPSLGAFETIGLDAFDTVLITGAGPVGMGAVVNARFRGARVILAEFLPWRVERARQMGVEHIVDPRDPDAARWIRELTGGRGVDRALDCSGTVAAERLCLEATRCKGKVAYVGECGDAMGIRVSHDLIRTGISITGSWHYNLNLYPKVLKVIQESPLIDLLVSHMLPMSGIQEAFELSASPEHAKIILEPWE